MQKSFQPLLACMSTQQTLQILGARLELALPQFAQQAFSICW